MPRSFRLLVAAALVASPAMARGQQSLSAQATVQRAADAWRDVKTVRASFEQTVTNALTHTSAQSKGDFQQLRPGKLSVRFRDPAGDQIISDGAFVWLYLPSSTPGQVIKQPLGRDGTGSVDLTSEFLDAPLSRYEVANAGVETLDGRPTRIVGLTPKAGVSVHFTHARVWIDDADGFIRQFEEQESSGVTRRVHLTALTVNAPVDDAVFSFVPPKGVRVVTR